MLDSNSDTVAFFFTIMPRSSSINLSPFFLCFGQAMDEDKSEEWFAKVAARKQKKK